ncbi:VOC family protein [Ochrobactrum sp. CM-21-5]|nr:VOC family protein [Ochrobactrum sp. CM-21-5]MBC2885282.1 VOC family protein [Ochrobactrum sp. CM-21-5]
MKNGASPFVWYELMTTDTAQAENFYEKVIGWKAKDAGVPGMKYTLFEAPGCAVAGMMALADISEGDCEGEPGWIGYIGVADVDAAAAKVADEGGKVLRPGDDIPNVGRFAIVSDPQGAFFALFSPKDNTEPPPDFGSRKVGHPGWHELYAKDCETVFPFYEKVFGWAHSSDFDMGSMGNYKIFSVDGADAGGIMTAPPGVPVGWGFYFMVDGVNAAADRVKSLGGSVTNGPMEVPNGEWIIQCRDPQGVSFSLVAPKQ